MNPHLTLTTTITFLQVGKLRPQRRSVAFPDIIWESRIILMVAVSGPQLPIATSQISAFLNVASVFNQLLREKRRSCLVTEVFP